nr:hypothetical protein [Tanacetum cinerariifolium]
MRIPAIVLHRRSKRTPLREPEKQTQCTLVCSGGVGVVVPAWLGWWCVAKMTAKAVAAMGEGGGGCGDGRGGWRVKEGGVGDRLDRKAGSIFGFAGNARRAGGVAGGWEEEDGVCVCICF